MPAFHRHISIKNPHPLLAANKEAKYNKFITATSTLHSSYGVSTTLYKLAAIP